jgi:signal transduction histidine kinase
MTGVGAEGARDRAQRLLALSGALAAAASVDAVAAVAVDAACEALGADSCGLYLVGDDGALRLTASRGFPAEVASDFAAIPADAPVPAAEVARGRDVLVLASPDEMRARYPALADVWEGMETRALVVVPLVVGDRSIGTLGLGFTRARTPAADELAHATAVAQQTAQALERVRLLDAERAARLEAEAANRAKLDFLAVMSHELRTPLNAIIGYEALIADGVSGPVNDVQRRQLGRIRASARHLLLLVDEMLLLSRLETATEVVRPEWVDVGAVVDEVATLIEPSVGMRGLRLHVEPPAAPIRAHADPTKLRQILLNLVSNAAKFTPQGAVSVRAWDGDGADGRDVCVAVRDTGVGIAPEHHEQIFEPFWQVEQRHTRAVGGTGLGLAVSRRLARLMGGDVTVDSAPGAGSTFVLRLPADGAPDRTL